MKLLLYLLFYMLSLMIQTDSVIAIAIDDVEESYLPFAEKMPEPVGGMEAIMKKVVYPERARSTRLEGKVYVMIYVDENGVVQDVKILKDIGLGCGNAVVEAVKKIKYTPGLNKGLPVKVKVAMAFNFSL